MNKKANGDSNLLIWVGCNDEDKLSQATTDVAACLDQMGYSDFTVIGSARNAPSLLDVMKNHDPNFFIRPLKHTYQDLYYDRDRRVDNAAKVLNVLSKEPGDENARMAIASALTILKPHLTQQFEMKEGELKNE